MAYKPLYDEAYLKTLISQIRKFNRRKNQLSRSGQKMPETPKSDYTQSQRAATVILRNMKAKKKGEKGA